MSQTSEKESAPPQHPRRRDGRRRALLRWLLLAALLLALVHQPLLRMALRMAAIRLAARENVRLSLEVEGSVWTQLTLKNVEAAAVGASPVEKIAIEQLRVEYNLWTLLRKGSDHGLAFYNLRNAKLVLEPGKGNADQKHRLAHVLRNILEQPLMRSDRAQIENFNLTLRMPSGTYQLRDVHALLDPAKTGYIRVGELTVPQVGAWKSLQTPATYVDRHLILRDFALGEEVRVARLELDASRRDKGIRYLSFEGTVLGGDLGLFLWQRAETTGDTRVQFTASLSNLPLAALGRYAGWKMPMEGMLRKAWVQMSGNPAHPADWEGQIQAEAVLGSGGGGTLGAASARLTMGGGMARLEKLEWTAGGNRLVFQAERAMPKTLDKFRLAGLDATFTLDAPELATLHPLFTGGRAEGRGHVRMEEGGMAVEGEAKAERVTGQGFEAAQARLTVKGRYPLHFSASGIPWYEGLAGQVHGEAQGLQWREFVAQHFAVDLPVEAGVARFTGVLQLEGGDRLDGEARVDLHAPFAYEGRLAGSVADLAGFQPFFPLPVAGALQIDWHGTGQIAQLRHTGEGRVALQHGRVGLLTGVEGELAGVYSPENIEITALRILCEQGTLQAGVRLRDQRLRVEGLRLTMPQAGGVTGSFSLPLDLRTPTRPATVFPATGPLEAALVLEPMDLARAFPVERLGLKGTVSGLLTAGGTLASPVVNAQLAVRDLQSAAAAKLAPAAGGAELRFKEGRVALSGSLAQPGLSPLILKGTLPLDLRRTLTERRLDPATPIACSVKLPPSSAGIFAPFLPGVRWLEGRLSVDASAKGTLEKPVFFGGLALDLSAIRFQDAKIPAVNHFLGDLRFSGTELTLQRFSGDMAGGPFSVTGKIRLEHPAEPVLDLRLQSQGTLLVRNDTLTLRADSDLRIAGPLKTAHVSGKIGITKSRFFREVEILPIGLPGRPAPKRADGWGRLSMDTPPFRDWTCHVAITTSEPFAIKGNLANGSLEGNLILAGTGLAPTLEGTARIENFVASLPFSRLTVDHGALYFTGNALLNPVLDIHGSSRIRDYNVNVYLYGTASEPQTLFTSEPSLPQEEVVALLATGATTREFAQNNQALAGRAAVLLFQDLYHKTFPRRPLESANGSNPFDRFSLDVGGVDPRTGKQELMGRFKLSDQFQIGAGVDVQGDARMQLQYLLRFR